jgi:hypothetical protein
MKHTHADIQRIEEINDVTIRLHFKDGLTLTMARKTYEGGRWQYGTHPGLIIR